MDFNNLVNDSVVNIHCKKKPNYLEEMLYMLEASRINMPVSLQVSKMRKS